MSNPDTPFICYGESYPIAKGLAMDAARPRRTLSDIYKSPRRPMAHDENTEEQPMDYDTALEDGQWGKLKDFLSDKLPDEHMKTVESICRKGGDAPKPGEDRGRPKVGASDAAVRARAYDSLLDGDEATLHARHRAGAINETQLALGLRTLRGKRRTTTQALDAASSAYAEQFPHAGRLKTGY